MVNPRDGCANKPDGFLGGQLFVHHHPGILLADVGVLVEVLVQARPAKGLSEGEFMKAGRARGHDDAVEVELLDLLLDHRLAGI